MKTTELIEKVKSANNVTILTVAGKPAPWTNMRELGYLLFDVIRLVEDGMSWHLYTKTDGSLVVAAALDKSPKFEGFNKSESIEFDSYGELENWSKVSEEEATQLLTKAEPVPEPPPANVKLFAAIFNELGYKYDDFFFDFGDDNLISFYNNETGVEIQIDLENSTIHVIKDDTATLKRKLKISFVDETPKSTPYVKQPEQPIPAEYRI